MIGVKKKKKTPRRTKFVVVLWIWFIILNVSYASLFINHSFNYDHYAVYMDTDLPSVLNSDGYEQYRWGRVESTVLGFCWVQSF